MRSCPVAAVHVSTRFEPAPAPGKPSGADRVRHPSGGRSQTTGPPPGSDPGTAPMAPLRRGPPHHRPLGARTRRAPVRLGSLAAAAQPSVLSPQQRATRARRVALRGRCLRDAHRRARSGTGSHRTGGDPRWRRRPNDRTRSPLTVPPAAGQPAAARRREALDSRRPGTGVSRRAGVVRCARNGLVETAATAGSVADRAGGCRHDPLRSNQPARHRTLAGREVSARPWMTSARALGSRPGPPTDRRSRRQPTPGSRARRPGEALRAAGPRAPAMCGRPERIR